MNEDPRFTYDGPPQLRPVITAALEQVVDPEVGLDIVAVGLVYAVTLHDDIVDVEVTMTSAACPVADVIVQDIENGLDRVLPPQLRIHVELVWEPAWTPQRLSAKARQSLGW